MYSGKIAVPPGGGGIVVIENEKPTIPQFQKNWDNINTKRIIANDLIFKSPRTGCTNAS
jgi:hypothetical protein